MISVVLRVWENSLCLSNLSLVMCVCASLLTLVVTGSLLYWLVRFLVPMYSGLWFCYFKCFVFGFVSSCWMIVVLLLVRYETAGFSIYSYISMLKFIFFLNLLSNRILLAYSEVKPRCIVESFYSWLAVPIGVVVHTHWLNLANFSKLGCCLIMDILNFMVKNIIVRK